MLHPALVLESTMTVAEAIAELDRYRGFANVAVRLEREGGATEWFALPVHRVRWLLEDANAGDALETALDLGAVPPTDTCDVTEFRARANVTTVVLDGGEVVGVATPDEPAAASYRSVRPEPLPAAPPPAVSAREPAAVEGAVVVPLLFATDRAPSDAASRLRFFGHGRGTLRFGVANVSIPPGHERGELESPTWWKLEFTADPRKHVAVLEATTFSRDEFVARGREIVGRGSVHDALVFVHGYNVSFENAARRTAQLAYDLRFRGLPMLYSWPSVGGTLKYFEDETNARWTVPHFREFLSIVRGELGASAVHVIAHSMGNRVVTEALGPYQPAPGAAPLRQLVLAAPDIDADTFAEFSAEFQAKAERVTLYASSNDLALTASRLVHGYPRAGDTSPELVIAEGIDTIDASKVETDLLCHSYVSAATSILADIYALLDTGQPPDERRFYLEPREQRGRRYWFMNARG